MLCFTVAGNVGAERANGPTSAPQANGIAAFSLATIELSAR
jgi:hypothetical protein